MNTCDCCGWFFEFPSFLNVGKKEIEEEQVNVELEKITGEQIEKCSEKTSYHSIQNPGRLETLVQRVLQNFQEEKIEPGLAIEFCNGLSLSAISLLQKGWKVIVVTSSQNSLNQLIKNVSSQGSNWLEEEWLTIICQNIEEYNFPKNVRLILTNDSLSYCHAEEIKKIWDNIYQSLENGGGLVGNFFLTPYDPILKKKYQSKGAWFTTRKITDFLIENKKYTKKIYGENKTWLEPDPKCIEFVLAK